MKKNIATLGLFALSALLFTTASAKNAEAQAFSQSPLLSHQITAQLTSPEAIAHYLWRNFRYETDRRNHGTEQHWQSPEEFLKNGKGDCEDFALMAKVLLQKAGKRAFLVSIYGHRYAHTICVFIENGKYHAIDGSQLKRYDEESFESVISRVAPHWEDAAIVTRSETAQQGRVLKRFVRAA